LQEEILGLVYAAIDDIEALSSEGVPLEKSPATPLLASGGSVDSLTLVNLVVAIEERLYSRSGKTVVLVDEDSLALEKNPFRSIGTLAEYVERVLNRAAST
jgi:acyl carrier protein